MPDILVSADQLATTAGYYAALATIVAAAVAVVGIVVATATYLSNGEANRSAHMHGLFREFLRAEMEFRTSHNVAAAVPSPELASDALSFRLYALEEMFAWLRKSGGVLKHIRGTTAHDHARAWERTIASHLRDRRAPLVEHFDRYADCYGRRFLLFAVECLPDLEELRKVVEHEVCQRETRPLGARRTPLIYAPTSTPPPPRPASAPNAAAKSAPATRKPRAKVAKSAAAAAADADQAQAKPTPKSRRRRPPKSAQKPAT